MAAKQVTQLQAKEMKNWYNMCSGQFIDNSV